MPAMPFSISVFFLLIYLKRKKEERVGKSVSFDGKMNGLE